jgi:SEC-C motif-containing protein
MDLREAGWGLIALGLRHSALRSEVFRFLRSPPAGFEALEPAAASTYPIFAETARLLDEKQDALREQAMDFGRKIIVEHTRDLDPSSAYRFTDVSKVPDELALPGVLGTWYDAHNGPRGNDVMLLALAVGASARAEDLYYPAAMLREVPPDDLEPIGASLAGMYWTLNGPHEPARQAPRPGRNEPCPCGSGKKYKKCHGA